MTPSQRELARHALGLPNARRTTYRNHFVAGAGHSDHQDWSALVASGYARRRAGSPLTGGDDLFWLTKAGALLALNRGERLDLEDFPDRPVTAAPLDTPPAAS